MSHLLFLETYFLPCFPQISIKDFTLVSEILFVKYLCKKERYIWEGRFCNFDDRFLSLACVNNLVLLIVRCVFGNE